MKTRSIPAVFMLTVIALCALPFVMLGVTHEAAVYSGAIGFASALMKSGQLGLPVSFGRAQLGAVGGGREVLDANEAVFFQRQLEHIKSKTFDIVYPELKAIRLLPVSMDAGPGAATIVYQQYDQVGQAKIIASYADDLPRADITGKEFTAKVRSIGSSYGYSLQEIRAANMAGMPLQQRKANAARRAIDQKQDEIAWFGDAAHGLVGFLKHPNVTRVLLPADGTGGSRSLASKTPDQVLRDLNTIANTPFLTTNGIEVADTMLFPLGVWTYLTNTARTSGTDTSILKWFMANNPFIKNIEWLNEVSGAGVLIPGADVIVAYRKDPDKLTLEIPQPFEQLPEERRNLEFTVACHQRTGGVIIYYPLSVAIGEGA